MVQHATDEASYLISQVDRDGDGRVSECCVVDGGGDSVCVCCMVLMFTWMCTVGVYKCVCVCPMCVLSVAISGSVSCVVCGTEA